MAKNEKFIDVLHEYYFKKKYRNKYTEQAQNLLFNGLFYKALNTDAKQKKRELEDNIKKQRGY